MQKQGTKAYSEGKTQSRLGGPVDAEVDFLAIGQVALAHLLIARDQGQYRAGRAGRRAVVWLLLDIRCRCSATVATPKLVIRNLALEEGFDHLAKARSQAVSDVAHDLPAKGLRDAAKADSRRGKSGQ
jgi:hypothetical protein